VVSPYDLVIRRGTIVDGTGKPGHNGDVAIKHGRIAAVGKVEGSGKDEIDATGRLVTPGFVDIHTHYDGHVTWTNRLSPSAQHGVTTALMGNCGVGFAPCRPKDRSLLIHLMEGIEDIPEVVMTEGLPWNWESFPDYLDRIEQRQYDIDVAIQLPHGALRVYVMGKRALTRDPATRDDIAQMRKLTRESVEAGAFGFSTSRNAFQQTTAGMVTPTYRACADELAGIALGLRDANRGVLQLVTDFDDINADFGIMRRMMAESGRPLSISLVQIHHKPDEWRWYLDQIKRAADEGFPIKGQVSGRPVGIFLGLQLARNPFMRTAGYRDLEHLPIAERVKQMQDPAMRARILAEMPGDMSAVDKTFMTTYDRMYEFIGDYEPGPERNLNARAAGLGIEPVALAYDVLTAGDGTAILCMPIANFAGNSIAAVEAMMSHEHTVLGLGDAGAHLGMIFDASMTTYMIERWSNVGRGTIPIERVIKALTSETAQAIELNDRGVIAAGYRADLNVIDTSRIAVGRHELARDLPGGRQRLHQAATGYDATIVAGEIIYREGVATGALPGRLIRSAPRSGPQSVQRSLQL